MTKKEKERQEMLLGTLDMLILRTLLGGAAHGHTIARMIEQTSDDVFEVEQGSLYPALHRLEDRRWVAAYWGTSENNRKAKFLQIDRSGAESIKRGAEPLAGAGRGDRESDARRTMQWLRSFAHPRRMLSR